MAATMWVSLLMVAVFSTQALALEWPKAYVTRGLIYMPYGEISEPFVAYINQATGQGRIDYFGGIAKVYYLTKTGQYGTMYKIVPETTNSSHVNVMTCFAIAGMSSAPLAVQSVLPDISQYTFVTNTTYQATQASVYMSSNKVGSKNNNYTLLVDATTGAPLVLSFLGYDRLFGSHYDKYIITYNSFSIDPPEPQTFQVPDVDSCGGFPGPGIGSPMVDSPFFEFFGAKGHSSISKTTHVDHHFNMFKKKHSKDYKTGREESLRKQHFHHNFRYINSMNRRSLSFKLAVNHMTDYTDNELRIMRGYRSSGPRGGTLYVAPSDPVPEMVNWRLRGAVTPVKDQGICGSCWSFGTTGTLEGSLFLKTGTLTQLSEQAFVDCSWGFGNNGCDGGESERAYQWMMKQGCVPEEMRYGPYLMQDGMCRANSSGCGASITGYHVVKSGDEDELMSAIANKGPISIAIDASLKSFSFYSDGVYYDTNCGNTPDDLDHQVLAVGYGTQDGQDYWLVKNSWSTHWGMDGYILMSRKDNNCGVATDASFGIMD